MTDHSNARNDSAKPPLKEKMTDTSNDAGTPSAGPQNPIRPSRRRRLFNYVVSLFIISLVAIVFEKVEENVTELFVGNKHVEPRVEQVEPVKKEVEHKMPTLSDPNSFSRYYKDPEPAPSGAEKLRRLDASFVNGVKHLDPFELASRFYGYVWNGPPVEDAHNYSGTDDGRPLPGTIFLPGEDEESRAKARRMQKAIAETKKAADDRERQKGPLARMGPAVGYTITTAIKGGPFSIVMAIFALGVGILVLRGVGVEAWPVHVLLAPIIGGCFLWVLQPIMLSAGKLLGGFLEAPHLTGVFSVITWGIHTVIKEREHHFTGKALAKITGKH